MLTHPLPTTCPDLDLHTRIYAEFKEMPGLKLTLRQAARLFNLEADQCARVMDSLVERGTLFVTDGRFVRAAD